MLGSWTALALTDRSFQQMITQSLASPLCFARSLPQEGKKLRRAGSKILMAREFPWLPCTPPRSHPGLHSFPTLKQAQGQALLLVPAARARKGL